MTDIAKIESPIKPITAITKINELIDATNNKQDTLVSGTNIKTINNQSILGSGNITIGGGGSSDYALGVVNPQDSANLRIWNGTEQQWNQGAATTWYNWVSSGGGTSAWSSVDISSITTNTLYSIIYANNKYTAVGASGTIIESTDGTNWSSITSPTANNLNKVIYANNMYIAVGASGTVLKSTDGTNWSTIDVSSVTTKPLASIVYANGYFWVGSSNGNSGLIGSSDGENWAKMADLPHNVSARDIIYTQDGYTVVGGSSTSSGDACMAYSTDGVNWSAGYGPVNTMLKSIIYANGKYTIVGGRSSSINPLRFISTSTSNQSTQYTLDDGTNSILNSVIYANNKYTTVGANGAILTSIDGETWVEDTSPTTNALNSIIYVNNKYIAVGASGTIITAISGTSTSCYTTDYPATTTSTVYSQPNTTSVLTITNVGQDEITLSDSNTYSYTSSRNQITYQTIGEVYPNYLCNINGVGVKIGTTNIANLSQSITVDQVYNASSTNPQSGTAIASVLSNKQDTLISGTNIKTVNGTSLLGSGNIDIQGGGSDYTAGDGINITGNIISVDSDTVTDIEISNVAISGSYTDLSNKPSEFTGTDGLVSGTMGFVPAPTTSDTNKYLKSDGTWSTVSGGTTYTAGSGIDITNDVISVDGQTTNEVTLATVATTGAFSDLSGTSGLQTTSNLVTSVSSSSTDSQYPSAKLFYDTVGNIETLLSQI